MYTIFTDTDTDITPKEASLYGYKLISMPYTINGVETKPYVDFEEFDSHTFYDVLRGGVIPTTSALSPMDYINYFEPEFEKGLDVVYVHFSAAMSGTFNALHIAMEDLKEKYPERTIHLIDTKGITLGSYNIVLEIGELYKQGKSIEELKAWAEENVDKYAVYFYADDLKFFGKSGRVSGFAAFMGNIIGLRPIIFMDSDGKMKTKDKCRGHKKTLNRLLDYVEELQDNMKDHRVIIGHTDDMESVLEIKQMMLDRFGNDLKIEIKDVNPTAGSHCGPNTVGISFYAKHR